MSDRNRGYVRTTISIPHSLKRKMDAVSARVNWSAVASEAFERKVAELTPGSGGNTMQETIARLRQTQMAEQNDASLSGVASGRKWAMEQATAAQLERLAAFRAPLSVAQWSELFRTEEGWRTLARELEPTLTQRHAKQTRAFWREILGDDAVEDLAFFRGFADGALGVWNEVKDHLG